MERIYIAGPMGGIPELNFPAFRRAAEVLAEQGYEPVSPLDLDMNQDAVDNGGRDRHLFLREDFRLLLDCDAIALLPGWEASVGANAELAVARMIGLAVYELFDGVLGEAPDALPNGMNILEAIVSPYRKDAIHA